MWDRVRRISEKVSVLLTQICVSCHCVLSSCDMFQMTDKIFMDKIFYYYEVLLVDITCSALANN